MRYAILSDIHGNLPAWNTVLSDLAVRKVDRILCLGDIVGYGPQPAECLKSVYSHAAAMLLGNHDAVVGGRMSAAVFNDRAQRVITWTQSRLGDKAQSLFAELPLVIKGPNFRCTHGDFVDPAMFRYVSTPEEAAESFAACPEQLLFCGHTHKAALYIIGHSGVVHEIPPQDFALEEGKRYLINVGSVGSPRDGDPRASYVIYDEERQAVFFIRVPFDFAAFRAAVAAAPGLRAEDVQLLRTAAVSEGASQVREEMDFEPNEAARVEGGAELEADLSRLKRTNRMLRTTVALLIAGGLAALVLGIVAVQTLLPHDVSLPAYSLPPITAVSILNSDGNALPALEPCYAKNDAVYCFPYRIFLDDRRVQSIGIDSEKRLVLRSSRPELETRLISPLITCFPGTRIEGMSRVRFSEDFEGSFQIYVIQVDKSKGEKPLFFRNFVDQNLSNEATPFALRGLRYQDGWKLARGTSDAAVDSDAAGIYVELSGAFRGEVTIGGLSLRRK